MRYYYAQQSMVQAVATTIDAARESGVFRPRIDSAREELAIRCADRLDDMELDTPVTVYATLADLLPPIGAQPVEPPKPAAPEGAREPNKYLDGRPWPVCYVDHYEGDPIGDPHSTVWLSCGHPAEAWHRFCPHCGRIITDRDAGAEG